MLNPMRIRLAFFAALICALAMFTEEGGEMLGYTWIDDWDELHIWETLIIGFLLLSIVILGIEVSKMQKYQSSLEDKVQTARTAFADMFDGYVKEWSLTDTEKDVTLLLLKGCSIAEIAEIRQTAEGTVKSQTNAIYKKSGLGSKTQLLSVFIEDLTGGESVM